MPDIRELATNAKAWPFQEARRVLKRVGGKTPEKGYVLFETGYGPSGPAAYRHLRRGACARRWCARPSSGFPTSRPGCSPSPTTWTGCARCRTTCRTRSMLAKHLSKPLTAVPDPFGTHDSFGAHNNARLRAFLDQFGFDYEFCQLDRMLHRGPLRRRRSVACSRSTTRSWRSCCRPCGEERRKTYSPFLPICPKTGHVLQVPVVATRRRRRRPSSTGDEDGTEVETPVTGGRCKLQWKPDWAMRWYALGVDYEMSGKDLIDSVQQSSRIMPGARRPAAGELHLRAVPGRERREDLEVARQRPDASTNGSPMRRRTASRCSCSPSRRRPSGFTSTSSRRTSTNTSPSCPGTTASRRSVRSRIRSGISTTAVRRRKTCR